jgi:acyl carrier protein
LTIGERVREYITETCYLGDGVVLHDDLSLIDSGIVDSTGMLDVILFLEDAFGIAVEDRETVPENLETVGRITAFVQRKLDAASAA